MTGPVHPIVAQLRAAREERGLSRDAVAARTGWTVYTVLQWEHGRRSPRLEGVTDYAAALGYTIALTPTGGPR